jgi:hypothetical protein
MADDNPPLDAAVAEIHEHLRATESLPLETTANRWLGEATEVVADVDGAGLPPEIVRERLEHVRRLLAAVDGTGHPEADAHVEAARDLVGAALS